MKAITIYGASDDLVEVTGDVPGCDEYSAISGPLYVELSTGDVFKVEYTDRGVWAVEHFVKTKHVVTRKTPHGDGDDPDPYTETVDVVGRYLKWVEVWGSWPVTDAEIGEKVGAAFERRDPFNRHDLFAIWEIVCRSKRRAKK